MKPDKILYVDDEAMALKYFERLVGPMAPVITALSVEEGKAVLQSRGAEVAVLISDQRMPGAHGNELLRYARDNHPGIVRMLTTAYSELGEAIEAINSGEIYRYITKPWDLESLRADLRNALELADLRSERDGLLREKMLIGQQQLLGSRVSQLAVVCAPFGSGGDESLFTYLDGAARAGCEAPQVDWRVMDHSDLMQAESVRGIALGRQLAQWHNDFGSDRSAPAAAQALLRALPQQVRLEDERLQVAQPRALYGALEGAAEQMPTPEATAWLAWLNWLSRPVQLQSSTDGSPGWQVVLDAPAPAAGLPPAWMAAFIERLAEPPASRSA